MGAEWLVGAWKLASSEVHFTGQAIERPWGPGPVGLLIYDSSGYMSVQIMRPGRPARGPRPTVAQEVLGTIAENEAIGYLGYGGRYEVDETARTIAHHVECSLLPEQVGTSVVRSYEQRGRQLVLRTPPVQVGDRERRAILTFERAPH
jgi:lipocalin-like protein